MLLIPIDSSKVRNNDSSCDRMAQNWVISNIFFEFDGIPRHDDVYLKLIAPGLHYQKLCLDERHFLDDLFSPPGISISHPVFSYLMPFTTAQRDRMKSERDCS